MENFTPVSGLIGGALIGAAATFLLYAQGRIAGVSGLLGGLFAAPDNTLPWRLAFLAGLPLGAFLVALAQGTPLDIEMQVQGPLLILAGVLVGIGTRIGSGCTSGHGVCGIARGSKRSIAATATFMAVAVATVFVTRHLLEL